jgi:hypothetical protein
MNLLLNARILVKVSEKRKFYLSTDDTRLLLGFSHRVGTVKYPSNSLVFFARLHYLCNLITKKEKVYEKNVAQCDVHGFGAGCSGELSARYG